MTEVEKMRSSQLADMSAPELQERFEHAKKLLAVMRGLSTYDDGYRELAAFAPVPVFIGPVCHFYGVHHVICQRGNNDSHGGRAAPIAADVVGAVGLAGVAFIQLIVVNHRRHSIAEGHIPQ